MSSQEISVPAWPAPRGYANGRIGQGRALHVAGQIGWSPSREDAFRSAAKQGSESPHGEGSPKADEHAAFAATDLVPQFARALDNVIAVVRAAGGVAEDIATMTIYVTDMAAYRGAQKELGAAWRARLGRHFPAMALVAVSQLVEPQAVVEIQATAYVGGAA